jgi:flagellar basal body-associated protein FliL
MELLYVLALLACPVGMGAMMWFMSKGMMGGNKQKDDASSTQGGSLQDLRKQQHELAADIARLEEHQVPEREPAPAAGR